MSIGPCVGASITPGVVQFDPAAFIVTYPAFASVPPAALEQNFQFATLQLANSCCNVVRDAPTRALLLGLLTAHITALLNGANGQPPQGVVGRISDATEGSVSVSAQYATTTSDTLAYYSQTPWGAQYWQSTLQYRTARYVAPRRRFGRGPWGMGYGGY